MSQQHKVWIDQCDATPNILNNFGVQPALHYLVGEKFLDFVETSEKDTDFEGELSPFAERVKGLFGQAHLCEYLKTSVHAKRDAMLVERARELLVE